MCHKMKFTELQNVSKLSLNDQSLVTKITKWKILHEFTFLAKFFSYSLSQIVSSAKKNKGDLEIVKGCVLHVFEDDVITLSDDEPPAPAPAPVIEDAAMSPAPAPIIEDSSMDVTPAPAPASPPQSAAAAVRFYLFQGPIQNGHYR